MSDANWLALKGACRSAGIPVAEFARRQGVTWSHLWRVVNGKDHRRSAPLSAAVAAFIASQQQAEPQQTTRNET